MKVKVILFLLMLLPIIAFSRIWYIGYEPGDFTNIESVVSDSSEEGDTIYVREGTWLNTSPYAILLNRSQLLSGAPGSERDSVIVMNSVTIEKGVVKNLNILNYQHDVLGKSINIRQFDTFDYALIENCRLIGPIQIICEWWLPGRSYESIIIRDCIIDTACEASYGYHIYYSGISFEATTWHYTFPASVFIYRNDFRNLVCGVGFGTDFIHSAWVDSIPIHNNYWHTSDTNWIKGNIRIHGGVTQFPWRPILDSSFSRYSVDAIDTTRPGIYFNDFDCEIVAWSSDIDQIPDRIKDEIVSPNDIFVLYPNPTRGIINIESAFGNYSLELFDISGRRRFKTTNAQNPISLPSDMEIGVYLYKITGRSFDESKTGKLVKLK